MINEADLDGVKKELNPLNHSRVADFAYDPRTAMRGHLPKTVMAQKEASSAATPAIVDEEVSRVKLAELRSHK